MASVLGKLALILAAVVAPFAAQAAEPDQVERPTVETVVTWLTFAPRPAPVPPGGKAVGMRRIAEVEVADGPKSVSFFPDGTRLWTNNLYGNKTQIIDAVTGKILSTMSWDGEPVEVGFRAPNEAWVSLYDKEAVLGECPDQC
jgi:hypothetical protein